MLCVSGVTRGQILELGSTCANPVWATLSSLPSASACLCGAEVVSVGALQSPGMLPRADVI